MMTTLSTPLRPNRPLPMTIDVSGRDDRVAAVNDNCCRLTMSIPAVTGRRSNRTPPPMNHERDVAARPDGPSIPNAIPIVTLSDLPRRVAVEIPIPTPTTARGDHPVAEPIVAVQSGAVQGGAGRTARGRGGVMAVPETSPAVRNRPRGRPLAVAARAAANEMTIATRSMTISLPASAAACWTISTIRPQVVMTERLRPMIPVAMTNRGARGGVEDAADVAAAGHARKVHVTTRRRYRRKPISMKSRSVPVSTTTWKTTMRPIGCVAALEAVALEARGENPLQVANRPRIAIPPRAMRQRP